MSNLDTRSLRHLTKTYLSAPDPLAWLATADLYEDAGDLASARMWRWRGLWYPRLREAFDSLLPGDRDSHYGCEISDSVLVVHLRRFPKSIGYEVWRAKRAGGTISRLLVPGGTKSTQINLGGVNTSSRFVRRLIEIIDILAEIDAKDTAKAENRE